MLRGRTILTFILIFCFFATNFTYAQGKFEYVYDDNNRLTSIKENGVTILQYQYNQNGSLIKIVRSGYGVPQGLNATKITSNGMDLSWNPVANATSYKVYKDDSYYATSTSPQIRITSLQSATYYSFSVSSIISGSESAKSSAIKVSTSPLPPTNLSASNITDKSLDLKWTSSQGATSYTIYQQKQGGLVRSQIGTSTNPSFTVTNLETETTYTFYVKSYNGSYSDNSNGLTVKTYSSNIQDTYEPNDITETAYPIESNAEYVSYIFSAVDVDFYKARVTWTDGSTVIRLKVPSTKDYDLYLYNERGELLSSSRNGIGQEEKIEPTLPVGSYYIKVIGFQADYSKTLPYTLLYFKNELEEVPYIPVDPRCPDPEKMNCLDPCESGRCNEPMSATSSFSEVPSLYLQDLEAKLDLLNSESIEDRLEGYSILAEIGSLVDISWLHEELQVRLDPIEQKEISFTIAKLGYKYTVSDKRKALSYLLPLFELNDEDIQNWLEEKLLDVYGDPEKVDQVYKMYNAQKAKGY